MSNKIIIVSNRLPVSVKKDNGKFSFEHTVGGLASGLDAVQKVDKSAWVGWPGIYQYKENLEKQKKLSGELKRKFNYYPVFQSQADIENYYHGYSNSTIWPLFHYFTQNANYDRNFWRAYKRVNKLFLDEVGKIVEPGDTVWIHDYHLMLLPQMLREEYPKLSVGFFLHIPFPSFEIFRLLPQREDILRGLLGADVVGFQTYEYTSHFLSSVYRVLGRDSHLGLIKAGDRVVKADTFPIGIDFEKFNRATESVRVKKEIKKLQKKLGSLKIILSIDRLDYTKGIPRRLEAFNEFLERYPKYKGKVILILVAVPSRTKIEEYMNMKKEIDELIGNINGKHGDLNWTPVWYLYKGLEFPELTALYAVSDVCLVTPIRDGMNLIAKEYVATKADGRGALILSEMVGAAEELNEALIINPNNRGEIVEAIKKALTMPKYEQLKRNQSIQKELSRFDEKRWVRNFMNRLAEVKKIQEELNVKLIGPKITKEVTGSYAKGKKRLLLLDYDGTLVSFASRPEEAKPDEDLMNLLKKISSDKKNEVVVISGRDKDTLESWFGDLGISLVAEHGVRIKENGDSWKMIEQIATEWKEEIRPVLDRYVERTPGSFVEEKPYSLVWHYRKSNPALGANRRRELISVLDDVIASFNLQVLDGNKVVEVKSASVSKGKITAHFLEKGKWDFILAMGDDKTDEDIFSVLPDRAYSIKVGIDQSQAKYNLKSTKDVRPLLRELK